MSIVSAQPLMAENQEKSIAKDDDTQLSSPANGHAMESHEGSKLLGSSNVNAQDSTMPTQGESTLTPKRPNSGTSSKRASKAEPSPATTSGPSASAPKPHSTKKKGGFLSFLNCCGGSSQDEDVDLQEYARPNVSGQPLDVQSAAVKQDKSAADSSLADTKDTKDVPTEKPATAPYSEFKSTGEPGSQEPETIAESSTNEKKDSIVSPTENVVAMPPTSTTIPSTEKSASAAQESTVPLQGEEVINDRTPQQEANDELAGDIPALVPDPVEEPNIADDSKTDAAPLLPPPPPALTRRQESDQINAQTNSSSEQQKWLLPPIRPEHRGRKCLVLDLDETLVHSSFKVTIIVDYRNCETDMLR